MTELPTVKVKWDNPQGFAYINQSDYDESIHELYDNPEDLTAISSGEIDEADFLPEFRKALAEEAELTEPEQSQETPLSEPKSRKRRNAVSE
jgi:hypothetical protein